MSLKFKVLLLFAFISFAFVESRTEFSVSDCSDVLVNGYLIRKVKRDEVESRQKNAQLKRQGKSYDQAIDYYEEIFFIPLDSIAGERSLSSILKGGVNFYDKQVFFFPSKKTASYLRKFCPRDVVVNESNNLFADKYYSIGQDSRYLYCIQFLEFEAAHVQVENSHLNRVYLQLRYKLAPSAKFFDCFFVVNIKENQQKVPSDSDIREWIKP